MLDLLMFFGSGIIFGIGATFGVGVSMWCVSVVRGTMIKESQDHLKKVEKLLEDKVDALWAINKSINEK